MAHLGDTPMLETASPFATPPTVIQTSITDIQRAMLNGIGTAIGITIGSFILYKLVGVRLR